MNRPTEAGKTDIVTDRRTVLLVASLASFLGAFMGSSLNVAIPSIGKEFAVSAVTLSWVATAYLLVVAMSLVPVGRLADIYGRKRLFLYGGITWIATCLLCGLAPSATLLITFRAMQGIAGSMFFSTSTAVIASVYPRGERGHALGISVAAVYAGLTAGPSVGGFMTQQFGWRSILFLCAALGTVIVALILLKIKAEWAEARGQKLDLVGSFIFALDLLAILYGFSELPSVLGAMLILIGIVGMVAFVMWESRVPNPVLEINLFRRNVVFALSNAAALIHYSATFAIGFMLSLYLQYVVGLDPQTAGLILLAQPAMMFVFSPLAGKVSDRIEPRIVASSGMAITGVGLVLLALLNDSVGVPYVVGALVIAGFGFALFSSPNSNAVMGSVGKSHLGIASATLGVMRSVGQALSMGISTLILALFVGGVQVTPQYHGSFSSAFRLNFIVFAALCVAGIACSLARGKIHNEAS